MSTAIEKRLRASVSVGAINGDSFERSVCGKQMIEAANEIDQLRTALASREGESSPQAAVPEGYVPMADYKQLSDLCSHQGTRLMDYETITGRMECKWTQDDDGIWHTACGNAHEFMNEGPAENEHHFCPYCGDLLSAGKGAV